MTGALAVPSIRMTIRVASFWPGQALLKRQHRRPFGEVDARRERQMKRFVMWTVLLASVVGALAAMTPASADPHGDRMKRDCASGARKC
jgi:hypothetical protein